MSAPYAASSSAAGVARASQTRSNKRAPNRQGLFTKLLKLYTGPRARKLAQEDCAASQQEVLRKLVAKAANTQFGRDHGFGEIDTVEDYQARVPLRTYNELWDAYWKDAFPRLENCTWPGVLPYFAVSSGTSTGKVKYIPCSREMVSANKRAALDVGTYHLQHRPDSAVFDGKCFLLGGSTNLTEHAPGIFSGDISGIAAKERPWWSHRAYFPPMEYAFLTDWEEKMAKMGPASLAEDIRMLTGGPNWHLLLYEKLAALKPDTAGRVSDFYPNLELIVHGGVSFKPYKERYEALLEGSRPDMREVYAASEGFIAIADRGPGMGMRLVTDNGLFFEFIPVKELDSPNPTRRWLGNVEEGVDYAIALTTCAGLWSYMIGDVVRFVDTDRPRVLITGRTSHTLSTFGEHLTGELVESAVLAAADSTSAPIAEFSVGTEVFQGRGDELGRHAYVVEFQQPIGSEQRLAAFGEAIDRYLAEANEDYHERRIVDGGVQAPRVIAMAPGGFSAWMKSIGKLGGQHKVPRVLGDWSRFEELIAFAERYRGN